MHFSWRMAESFECKKSGREISNGVEEEEHEGMYMGDVEKADGFCYLEDAINSSGGCERLQCMVRRCRLGVDEV